MELEEARAQINQIDDELVSLFVRRMGVAAQIAAYKKAHGLPVLDCARERAILDRASRLAGDALAEEIRPLFAALFEASRAYQQRLLAGGCAEKTDEAPPDFASEGL
ncbi:MAG: chorismate mutase [Oscillospiraceae bacterium]